LITQNYLADPEVMEREFRKRFVKYYETGLGLFWIPIQASRYDKTELGTLNIAPAWGFRSDGPPSTVEPLPPVKYPAVWIEISERITEWWSRFSKSLADKLEDILINKQIIVQQKIQKLSLTPARTKDKAQILRILPCLINRVPQESSFRRAAVGRDASKKIVFVLPGRREERADRFADRLDCCTISAIRAKGTLQGNIEFCRAAWPAGAETDNSKELFPEYLDAVSRCARLDLEFDYTKGDEDTSLGEAAALLKVRMRDTRFVFWTEIAATSWGQSTGNLFATVLAWWKRFVPLPGVNSEFVAPIVVLAPTTTNDELKKNLSEALSQEHVQMLTELQPIEYQDMVNWLTLDEVRGVDSIGGFRGNIDALYPKGDELICFSTIEKNVVTWLAALN
jgi:hypothetical protein